MARRIGDVDEFEFKDVGENHNQGVSIFSFISITIKEKECIFMHPFYFVLCEMDKCCCSCSKCSFVYVDILVKKHKTSAYLCAFTVP